MPFHFLRQIKEKNLKIKLPSTSSNAESEWKDSGDLDVSTPGDIQFICQTEDRKSCRYFTLSVTLEDAYLFMTLEEQSSEEALIQLHNRLPGITVTVTQHSVPNIDFLIPEGATIPFGWPEPSIENKLSVRLLKEGKEISTQFDCSLEHIDKVKTEILTLEDKEIQISYHISLKGASRIVHFYTEEDVEPIGKPTKDQPATFRFRADLAALGISIISAATAGKKHELAYICLTPVTFMMVERKFNTEYQLRVSLFIIDNNMMNSMYPVIMFPANLKPDQNFLDIVVNMYHREKETDILCLKYIGFYMCDANLCLDTNALNIIPDFVRSVNKVLNHTIITQREIQQFVFLPADKKEEIITRHKTCKSWKTLSPSVSTKDYIFIDKLNINPVTIYLTFKNVQIQDNDSFINAFLQNALGKVLANFDNAPIKLNGLHLSKTFGTSATVLSTIQHRYKKLTTDMVMGVVLSSNIIGNPKKLFDKISSGMQDLVEKPKEGFLQGPLQGSKGILTGAGSFAAKTFGATFSSIANISDSLASGLTAMSGDKTFIEEREKNVVQENKNLMTGSVQAAKSIGKGFMGGISDLIEKPYSGAKEGGVGGFFKGVLSGTKGLIVKPVAGVLSGVSKMTEGVSNSLMKDNVKKALKSRPPRVFYGYERIFKVYNEEEPKIMKFLSEVKPKYGNFIFLDSIFIPQRLPGMDFEPTEPTLCVWFTFERIFLVVLGEKKSIAWRLRTPNIAEVVTDNQAVEILTKEKSKSLKNGKARIPCENIEIKEDIFRKIGVLREIVDEYLGLMN